ncbi:MAG: NAD-dependent epimerase/dehydratase family protein [Phototrophicaceae bacterium]
MQIFVTGGSGFVGQHLIPRLVAAGHNVKALARSAESVSAVESVGAVAVHGDMEGIASLTEALHGCEMVIHAASAFDMWGEYEHFYTVNVQGTQALLAAAQASAVRRFIYISAASVISGGVAAENVDETYRLANPPPDAYSKTKLLAEQAVIAANSAAFHTIALRPALIWGKGHFMVERIRARKAEWMWINGGQSRISPIHVENLVAAILAAMNRGQGGQVYFVSDGQTWTIKDFLQAWLGREGVILPDRNIPRGVALLAGRVMERLWLWMGRNEQPPITEAMVFLLATDVTLNDTRARNELGYRNALTPDEGLARLP